MSRTIATLAAVVALTLAACGSGTSDTTTTEDTRGWSEEAFRDVMAFCQASGGSVCAKYIISLRDAQCSIEATYLLIDETDDVKAIALVEDRLHPADDCLGLTIVRE